MITSIKHKGLKLLWTKNDSSKLPADSVFKIRMILQLMNSATDVHDLNTPGARLHELKGNLSGYWSITVNGNYRIIFQFFNGDASLLDFVDYH